MAEEEVVAVAAGVEAGADVSPVQSDHKRKLEDLEPRENEDEVNAEPQAVPTSEGFSVDLNADSNDVDNSVPDAKRPRLDEDSDVPAAENGHQGEKLDEKPEDKLDEKLEEVLEGKTEEKLDEQLVENQKEQAEKDDQVKNAGNLSEAKVGEENAEKPSVGHQETGPAADGQQSLGGDFQQPTEEVPEQRGDLSSAQHQSQSEEETMSRKMEVPNNKVGVLIGKAGDTIRFLQYNSGAKIQITRDAEADRYSSTRPVELIGSLENINKAEKLIKDVIAEADAGGSPSLVARGFGTAPPSGAAEQLLIQVPNEKVGLIIGKGGDTIKNLQTRSGARIQLIPQHLPEGDQSKERTVRVSGDKKQIEVAREMIKDVMDQQPVRASPLSGGNQQGFRPRGPTTGPAQWGGSRSTSTPRGSSYDYPQRGPPSQNPHYPPPSYGGYPSQQSGPRGGNYNSSWDHHRHPGTQPHSSQGGSGYDYYGQGQGGNHVTDHPPSGPASNAGPVHGSGPSSQGNYYGGHPQGGPEYGPPPSYQQTAPPQQQGYGPGYEDPKYANQPAVYGGHGNSQPGGPYSAHQPGNPQPGYNQQPYGNKAPSYGMPPQGGPASQTYGGMTRTGQPAEMPPYQGGPTYGSNMPAQQGYPYGGPTQQSYPPYGSAPATANDGYSQPLPNPASGYPPQQGAHSGYGQQPGVQPTPGYAQGGGQSAGYGPYPSAQPGYTEQPVPTSAGYGYQGIADPGYNNAPTSGYGAPPGGQAGYGQPVPNQTGYEQPIPQPGGAAYSNAPAAAAAPVAGYAKNVSPQPAYPQQFDSTQMYGGHH